MKKVKGPVFDKDGYEKHPFGKNVKLGKPVANFLPPPGTLRFKNPEKMNPALRAERENMRSAKNGSASHSSADPVTISVPLTPKSLDYFKRRAKQEKVDYGAVIAAFIEEHLPVR